MKILIDLNIFNNNSQWEDGKKDFIQEIFDNVSSLGYELLVHFSQNDKLNELEKKYKLPNYKFILEKRTIPQDDCLKLIKASIIDILITEEINIIKKANLDDLDEFVLTFEQFRQFLRKEKKKDTHPLHGTLFLSVDQIEEKDKIWDSLKHNYPHLDEWLAKVREERRKAWVYSEDIGKDNNPIIQAICIFKIENNPIINNNNKIIYDKVLKLCTFFISEEIRGKRIAERLLFAAIKYALKKRCKYIYLHSNDSAVLYFCEKFGFINEGEYNIAGRNKPDFVYVKSLDFENQIKVDSAPSFLPAKYYPYYNWDNGKRKVIVNLIDIEEQNRLFPDFRLNYNALPLPLLCPSDMQSNNINKSFICNSINYKIPDKTLILFYCKQKLNEYIAIGRVDKCYYALKKNNITYAQAILSKRAEYNASDLNKLMTGKRMIILFILLKYIEIPQNLKEKFESFNISNKPSIIESELDALLKSLVDERSHNLNL